MRRRLASQLTNDVKVVQELLRHGSAKVTLDVYAQAQRIAENRNASDQIPATAINA